MFYGCWSDAEEMMGAFEISKEEMEDVRVVAAVYEHESYDGSAMVVFRKEGKLYEVHGSHCSCYGLEGQWNPEEISYEALMDRLEKTEDHQVERFGAEFTNGLKKGLVDEMFDREVLEN
jgi:hypothetical protein